MIPCQDCGRPAFYRTKRANRKLVSRKDHDLCSRCWRKRMDAIDAREGTAKVDFRSTTRFVTAPARIYNCVAASIPPGGTS